MADTSTKRHFFQFPRVSAYERVERMLLYLIYRLIKAKKVGRNLVLTSCKVFIIVSYTTLKIIDAFVLFCGKKKERISGGTIFFICENLRPTKITFVPNLCLRRLVGNSA